MLRAILVQHHALAWLPLPLAPMRPTPLRPLHQPGRMQLCLGPRVAPRDLVTAPAVLVKILPFRAAILRRKNPQLPLVLVRFEASRRLLPQARVEQPRLAFLLEPLPVASELALRHSQQLPS